jgi:hypothetical protein
MVKNRKVLYVSPSDGKVYSELDTTATVSSIELTQGDSVTMELHMCKLYEGELIEVPFPANSQLKLAVGNLDAAADSGTYVVTYGGISTTVAFNVTAAVLQTTLNSMASIASSGGVTVATVNEVVNQVTFNEEGVNGTFELDVSGLAPTMYGRVIPIRVGDSTHRGIYAFKIAQAPVIYQTQWADRSTVDATQAVITTIKTGHKRLTLDPAPMNGLMAITTTPNVYRKTYLQGNLGSSGDWLGPPALGNPPSYYFGQLETIHIPVTADDTYFQFRATAQQQNFYNYVSGNLMPPFVAFNDVEDYFQPHVVYVAPGIWDFIWNYDPAWQPPMWLSGFYFTHQNPAYYTTIPNGYNYPLSVNIAGVPQLEGKIANLNLNSIDIEYFLDGNSSVTGMLEIELTTDDYKQTILQSTCTIKNDMIDGYAYSPIELDVATIPDAPSDGVFYGRKNGGWTPLTEIDGGTY